jgi:hypothetical protein
MIPLTYIWSQPCLLASIRTDIQNKDLFLGFCALGLGRNCYITIHNGILSVHEATNFWFPVFYQFL